MSLLYCEPASIFNLIQTDGHLLETASAPDSLVTAEFVNLTNVLQSDWPH